LGRAVAWKGQGTTDIVPGGAPNRDAVNWCGKEKGKRYYSGEEKGLKVSGFCDGSFTGKRLTRNIAMWREQSLKQKSKGEGKKTRGGSGKEKKKKFERSRSSGEHVEREKAEGL